MNHINWHTKSPEEVEKVLETSFEKGLSEEEIRVIEKNNIEISNIPLQKLFIYLTENISKEVK